MSGSGPPAPGAEQHARDEAERGVGQAGEHVVEVVLFDGAARDERGPREREGEAPERPARVVAAAGHEGEAVVAGAFEAQPLDEQRRIVEVVDSYFTRLDGVAATLERVRRNLKRYRASILKAAVEGRLVPTEAEIARAEGRDYEPASVLLQRILVERRRRWEEAELARMKAAGRVLKNDKWKARYKEPAAPDTATLPPLPEGWCWVTVDQVLSEPLVNGRSVKSADRGFPILRLTSLRNGTIDLNECKIGAWNAGDARRFLVRLDDFFVSRGNGSIRLVAAGGLVREVPDPIAFPDTLIRIRVCSGIDLRFLAAMWSSRIVRGQLEQKAKTTAGIFKVNQDDLATCVLPLPPLVEQIRIRNATERLFADGQSMADRVARSSQRAKTLYQSVLESAFAGALATATRTINQGDLLSRGYSE